MRGSIITKPLTVLIFAAVSLAATTVMAEPVTYECRATQRVYPTDFFGNFRNLIQSQMIFVVDRETGTATVWDPLLEQVYGGPVAGTLKEESDRKLVVTWDVFARGFNLAQARMQFRAALIKQGNKLIVTAIPIGYQQRFFARGGCVQTSPTGS